MCQIAVDFAKHGQCVNKNDFVNLQKIKNKRDRLKVDKKDQILDQLNKNLFIEEYYNSYIKKDWQFAILKEYTLNKDIILLAKDCGKMLSYLVPCYERIVKPMSEQIKKIMLNFYIATEGEFFSCDLNCRINSSYASRGQKPQHFSDPSANNKDASENLKMMKTVFITFFKSEFN